MPLESLTERVAELEAYVLANDARLTVLEEILHAHQAGQLHRQRQIDQLEIETYRLAWKSRRGVRQ